MKQNPASQSGIFNPRVLVAFVLCLVGALLALLSFAAPPPIGMTGSRTNSPGDSLFVGQRAGPLSGKANAAAALSANLSASVDPSFTAVGSMTSARQGHTATLLGNGKVLITGGYTGTGNATTNTAELFDPASGAFTSLSPNTMTSERWGHTATLLPSGKVLIAGGYTRGAYLNTAELFDPASGTFTALPPMTSARSWHTATLLPSGKVLIIGGYTGTGSATTNTAELFDPASGTFTLLPNTMTTVRVYHTATLLPSGKVLIAGGFTGSVYLNTAELFDPASGTFTALPPMTSPRAVHTATVLPGGKVLIAGGFTASGFNGISNTAELFDPASGTFTALPSPMSSARYGHTATLLPSGKVLIAGGLTGVVVLQGVPLITAELFDPASGTFMLVPPMTLERSSHTATLLPSGKVLITGGITLNGATNTAELFDPASGTFTSLLPNTMISARLYHTATLLPSGKVLIAGGYTGMENTNTAELFDPASGTFTALPPMTSPRSFHTATLLPGGKVLITGGFTGSGTTNTAELFDPASGAFTALPPMTSPRRLHTATLLPNSKVLIAGGFTDGIGSLNTAELFDPASGTFRALPTMTSPRRLHTATLLPNSKVLIAGGLPGNVTTNTAELFDPVSGTFTSLSPNTMTSARVYHTATLLPSGKVLIAGGFTGSESLNTAELFDPVSGTFTSLSPNTMTSARAYHTATLLPGGNVLIAGGYTMMVITNTAELFDPAFGTFTSLSPNTMTLSRSFHTATLLPSGKVLIAGGAPDFSGNVVTNTAELFDPGLGFSDARRPVISTVPNPLVQPASLVLTGIGFRGDSEAAGGSYNSSDTNYPLLQLVRIDNEQSLFVPSDPATNWSDTRFSSQTLGTVTPFPTGYYRVTIFTNAIPSLQKIINIGAPPLQLLSAGSRKTHGSAGTFDVNLPFSFNLPTPPPGIECRVGGGTGGDHTLVFTFNNIPVSGSATVASGTGSVLGSPTFAGHEMRVNLTGVANAQVIGVTLNVTDSFGQSFVNPEGIPVDMGVLLGDVNSTRLVDGNDVSAVQGQARQTANSTNFRLDVNTTGLIDGNDVSLVQSKTRSSLPSPP